MARKTPSEKFDKMIEDNLRRPRPRFSMVEIEQALGRSFEDVGISLALRDLPRSSFKERLRINLERRASMAAKATPMANFIREGFHSITPYLIVPGAAELIDFMKSAFEAEERFRVKRPGEDAIMHAELKIGDSMIELAEANAQFPPTPAVLVVRVGDVDATYNRAIQAGATTIEPPADQSYGVRSATIKDMCGNSWNIFTPAAGNAIFENFYTVTPHMNPVRAPVMIEFLQKAFGAEEVYRAQLPDGSIPHAQVRVGDSIIGMGEAHGPYQPMPCTLHLYVPDADAAYERALRAGATSIQPPADQPYGERSGGVTDPFGNRWFVATHLRDVAIPG
jgi:PhnB protein